MLAPDVTVDSNTVEQVDNFVHLGNNQSSDGSSQSDMKRRIGLASAAMTNLERSIPVAAYKSLGFPNSWETWTILAADRKRL